MITNNVYRKVSGIPTPSTPYIDHVGNHAMRRVRQQRLQRLQHLVHVVPVDQPTQNARLLLDHEHGLRHARVETLFLKTRDRTHLDAVLEIGGIQGRHFFDGVQDEERTTRVALQTVRQRTHRVQHVRTVLGRQVEEQCSSGEHNGGVDGHEKTLCGVEEVQKVCVHGGSVLLFGLGLFHRLFGFGLAFGLGVGVGFTVALISVECSSSWDR